MTELRPIKKNVTLATIAKRLNVDVALLKKLNPELRRNATPRHFAGTYFLRVPQSKYSYKLDEVEVEVARLAKPESKKEVNRRTAFIERTLSSDSEAVTEIKPKFHRVVGGDTLFSIARKYHTTPRKLAEINGLKTWKTKVQKGQRLKLTSEDTQRVATRTLPKVKVTNRPIVYKIRRGDNLTDLAKIFDIKLSKIKKANNIRRGKVLVGQSIVLPDTRKGIYVVRKGDHLTKVARELKQPVEALIKLNSLKRGAIYPGQKIIVNMD
jgi:LysM repeat protein